MPSVVKLASLVLFLLLAGGCATTYVPISWGQGEKVKELSSSDLFLATLFDRYDPRRSTLRVAGESFDQVMMPSEVKYHLGAYRPDSKLIYRNLYQSYSDDSLRSLILHELAHHIWHTGMSQQQREQWRDHLSAHPSPFQDKVRRTYPRWTDWDNEDFAYTVENARDIDIEQLAGINLISAGERDALLLQRAMQQARLAPQAQARLDAAGASRDVGPESNGKGNGPAK